MTEYGQCEDCDAKGIWKIVTAENGYEAVCTKHYVDRLTTLTIVSSHVRV